MTSIGSSTSTTPTTVDRTDRHVVARSRRRAAPDAQSIGGLATGLDTNAIIAALVASRAGAREPDQEPGIARDQLALQSYALIRTGLTALSTATLALARPAAWNTLTATSSNTDVASVTAGSGTFSGTLSFTVDSLATAGSVRSTQHHHRARRRRSPRTRRCSSRPAGRRSGSRPSRPTTRSPTGAHTITVTQASSAATKSGDSALGGSTVIDGTNDSLAAEHQRHADDAHARARHVHREPARAGGAGRGDVRRRAAHRVARRGTGTLSLDHDPRGNRRRRCRSPAATRSARWRCRPTAPRTPAPTAWSRSTAAPNRRSPASTRARPSRSNAAAGTITATLAGGLHDRHGQRQQRQHRRRQPRDRRRQHQRRRRRRDRDGGAGRASTPTGSSSRRTPPARSNGENIDVVRVQRQRRRIPHA